jgi:cystathionine gamma-synthase
MSPDRHLSRATLVVTAGRPDRAPDAPLETPVTLASTYHAGGEMQYGRYGNPVWSALETAVGALEGGHAVAFASGTATAAALLHLVPTGGRVVVSRGAYLGTTALLTALAEEDRLELQQVDTSQTATALEAVRGAAMLWVETPSNPLLVVSDVAALAAGAHEAGALVVVDNTFATPLGAQPLGEGADLVMHSATKAIAGHADVVLGIAVARDEGHATRLAERRKLTGSVPGPFEAWLALRGLRTLALRVAASTASAAELARRVEGVPGVGRVRYPGFGAVLSVELADAERADAFVDATRLWVHATSLGGVESTLERRRRWAGESPDVPEGLVRLSVGIEDVDDLWADLEQALTAAVR